MSGKWYRTTAGWFRSFSGPRRISAPERTVHGLASLSVPVVTREYHGPVYARDTNFEYIGPVLNAHVHREMLNEAKHQRKSGDPHQEADFDYYQSY